MSDEFGNRVRHDAPYFIRDEPDERFLAYECDRVQEDTDD